MNPNDSGEPIDPNAYPGTWQTAGPYGGPPAPYPQGYPPPGWGSPPGSGPPGPPSAGWPAPPYPVAPVAPGRPGTVLAAAVLAFIAAGLLVIAALLLLAASSAIAGMTSGMGVSDGGLTVELAVDGVADLVGAGLLIAGGASAQSGRRSGRPLLLAGASLVVVLSIYWLARAGTPSVGTALLFAALGLTAGGLLLSPSARDWFEADGHHRSGR